MIGVQDQASQEISPECLRRDSAQNGLGRISAQRYRNPFPYSFSASLQPANIIQFRRVGCLTNDLLLTHQLSVEPQRLSRVTRCCGRAVDMNCHLRGAQGVLGVAATVWVPRQEANGVCC